MCMHTAINPDNHTHINTNRSAHACTSLFNVLSFPNIEWRYFLLNICLSFAGFQSASFFLIFCLHMHFSNKTRFQTVSISLFFAGLRFLLIIFSPFLSLSVCLSVSLSLSLCQSVSVFLCLSLCLGYTHLFFHYFLTSVFFSFLIVLNFLFMIFNSFSYVFHLFYSLSFFLSFLKSVFPSF